MKNRIRVLLFTAVLLSAMAVGLPGLKSRQVAAQGLTLTGSYGFTATVPYSGGTIDPAAVVGVIKFDGAGNLTGSETVVSPDSDPKATSVKAQTLSFNGTYTLNADGTGTMNIQSPGGPATQAFVLTDGGTVAQFVETSGVNFIVVGTARKQ